MNEPALKVITNDKPVLRGHDAAKEAVQEGVAAIVVESAGDYAAMSALGLPVIFAQSGKWSIGHAELVGGWELCFAFTSPEFRMQIAKIADGHIRDAFLLTAKKLGEAKSFREWIAKSGNDADVLIDLTFHAERYEYRDEIEQRGKRLTASAFEWQDLSSLPQRDWIYGNHLLRKYVSVTIAPGGVGKSRLIAGEALAMASGRNLFNQWTRQGLKVWVWNLEDDMIELKRCILAACKLHGVKWSHIAGNLFLDSGRSQELCTAIAANGGAQIQQSVYDNIAEEIKARGIDVLIVDPFVSSHRVNENDNGMIDAVVKAWAKVADVANCAIELVHHTRKEGGGEITADSARGGSAIMGAARDVRVLNRMTKENADRFGLESERGYFRVQSDKSNFAPIEGAQWYHIKSVSALNDMDGLEGDSVGVCELWTPPDPFDDITEPMMRQAVARIAQGDCKHSPQAADWAGHKIADILNIDTQQRSGESIASRVLWKWEQNKLIGKVYKKDSGKGREIPYYQSLDK